MPTAKQLIIFAIFEDYNAQNPTTRIEVSLDDLADLDEKFDNHCHDELYDTYQEFRESGIPTNIRPEWSRHYETDSVARKLGDKWVGWTYYYGGGKYGEPEAIPYEDDAYFLNLDKEVEVVEIKRTFSKVQ